MNVIPKGDLPIDETVAYFDYSLEKFFATAEKMPWYKNTLFIITGDHIGPGTSSARMLDYYRVPIVFFHPGGNLPQVNRQRIIQHVDIEPSVLDYLGIANAPMLPFGHSIFDPSYDGLALGQKAGNYWIAAGNYYLESRLNESNRLFRMDNLDTALTSNAKMCPACKLSSKLMFNGSTTASQKTICIAESGLGRSLLFFTQHRAPTAPAAAKASMLALGRLGMLLSDLQIVVVSELFPRRDIAARLDEDSMMLLLDLAIRRARMIDPASRVSFASRVDDQAVVDGKQHRVR